MVLHSYKDRNAMYKNKVREDKRNQTLKKYFTTELIRKQNRARLLDTLERESEFWLSNEEFWTKHKMVVIPNPDDVQSDYFVKLQEVR